MQVFQQVLIKIMLTLNPLCQLTATQGEATPSVRQAGSTHSNNLCLIAGRYHRSLGFPWSTNHAARKSENLQEFLRLAAVSVVVAWGCCRGFGCGQMQKAFC